MPGQHTAINFEYLDMTKIYQKVIQCKQLVFKLMQSVKIIVSALLESNRNHRRHFKRSRFLPLGDFPPVAFCIGQEVNCGNDEPVKKNSKTFFQRKPPVWFKP